MRKRPIPPPPGVNPALWELFSRREREIMVKFMLSPHDKAIAAALNVSPSTVRSHLTSIQAKLGVDPAWNS